MLAWDLFEIWAFMAFYYSYYYKGSIKLFYKFYTVTRKFFHYLGKYFYKKYYRSFLKKLLKVLSYKNLLVILFSNSWKGLTEIFENFLCTSTMVRAYEISEIGDFNQLV